MSDFLEDAVRWRRMEVAASREIVPDAEMRANAGLSPSTRLDWFHQSLRNGRANLAVIAEVKRVSPALGVLG